jgi:hypothetical protein
MRKINASFAILLMALLVGCAGMFVPNTFEDKVAYAEQSYAATKRIAAKAILAKKEDGSYLVSDDAAKCVRNGFDLAGNGIDQAKAFHASGNDTGALKALDIAAAGLDALASYLNGGNPVGNCDALKFFGG